MFFFNIAIEEDKTFFHSEGEAAVQDKTTRSSYRYFAQSDFRLWLRAKYVLPARSKRKTVSGELESLFLYLFNFDFFKQAPKR